MKQGLDGLRGVFGRWGVLAMLFITAQGMYGERRHIFFSRFSMRINLFEGAMSHLSTFIERTDSTSKEVKTVWRKHFAEIPLYGGEVSKKATMRVYSQTIR